MYKITLTREKETLLIPLYGKAMENKRKRPILADEKAVEIVNGIDYDFKNLRIQNKTNTMLSLRAKLIDEYVERFLSENSQVLMLHLGCGLDSRCLRVKGNYGQWFDVDFQEVIALRSNFYTETAAYRFIGSSVTEAEWIQLIPTYFEHVLVVAEGLTMYLEEEKIKTLIGRLKQRVGSFTFVFDAYSSLTAQRVSHYPSLKKTGSVIRWGIDEPELLARWDNDIAFLEEIYLTNSPDISKLDWGSRMMYGAANKFLIVKRAHRILAYHIGPQ